MVITETSLVAPCDGRVKHLPLHFQPADDRKAPLITGEAASNAQTIIQGSAARKRITAMAQALTLENTPSRYLEAERETIFINGVLAKINYDRKDTPLFMAAEALAQARLAVVRARRPGTKPDDLLKAYTQLKDCKDKFRSMTFASEAEADFAHLTIRRATVLAAIQDGSLDNADLGQLVNLGIWPDDVSYIHEKSEDFRRILPKRASLIYQRPSLTSSEGQDLDPWLNNPQTRAMAEEIIDQELKLMTAEADQDPNLASMRQQVEQHLRGMARLGGKEFADNAAQREAVAMVVRDIVLDFLSKNHARVPSDLIGRFQNRGLITQADAQGLGRESQSETPAIDLTTENLFDQSAGKHEYRAPALRMSDDDWAAHVKTRQNAQPATLNAPSKAQVETPTIDFLPMAATTIRSGNHIETARQLAALSLQHRRILTDDELYDLYKDFIGSTGTDAIEAYHQELRRMQQEQVNSTSGK